MIRRTIEISNSAYLSIKNQQLVIKNIQGEHSIPAEDIGFIVLDHPQITLTQNVLVVCAEFNIALIPCDKQHLPCAGLMSMQSNSLQGKIMRAQVLVDETTKQSLWKQIIQAKIIAQNNCLRISGLNSNSRLARLASTIDETASNNYESQAAKIYFPLLFGKEFRRNSKHDGMNSLLNYGYTIVRSACARSIALTGLHPAFGLQHHNQYNVFCLADDIMEPLRPLVDVIVFKLVNDGYNEINSYTKNQLLQVLSQSVTLNNRQQPLMISLQEYCNSLKECLLSSKKHLKIPYVR